MPRRYPRAVVVCERVAKGKKRRFGVIRGDGGWVFEPKYANVGVYNQDRVPVSDDGEQWGFADETGKIAIPTKYGFAYNFVSGAASVQSGHAFCSIDRSGKR